MSTIKCYTNSPGASVAFLRYRGVFEAKISNVLGQELLQDDHLRRLIDPEKLQAAINNIRKERHALVKELALQRLGLAKKLSALPSGAQDEYDVYPFKSTMHPMGELMEAVIKAATGQTPGLTVDLLDGRSWYTPRRFVVELPEQRIIIDEAEMDGYPKFLIENSKTPWGVVSTLGGKKDKSLDALLFNLRKALAEPELREAAIINACTIELATTRHAEGNPARATREKEDADAQTIQTAIQARVSARAKGLAGWIGTPEVRAISVG